MGTEIRRPALRYFGGKFLLAPWIISNFPPHRVYVEPFGGAASVLIRKPRAWAEVYNDLDDEIVNVFRVLQDSRYNPELERVLRLTPYSRAEFDLAHESGHVDAIERARRTIIRSFMGHGADSVTGCKSGFRAQSNQSNRTPAADWYNFAPAIPLFLDRLRGVTIENRPAKAVMAAQDGPSTLHFVDPPYVHGTRSHKHGYRFEMTDDEHRDLCDFLKTLSGMVVLCGYDNDIYRRLGWHSVRREAHADGARDRVEVLWMNAAAVDTQVQIPMFGSEDQ